MAATKGKAPLGKIKAQGGAPTHRAAPVRIPKASEIVASQIRKSILRGELQEGENLPSENEISSGFGISRPTLREALRILESEHFISVSRGSRTGAVIHKPGPESVARYAGFTLQAEGATLAEVYEARLAIEPYVAGRLAAQKSPKIVKKLREEIAKVRKLFATQDGSEFRVSLARLHLALVELLGNGTFVLFITIIEQIIERHQFRFNAADMRMSPPERAAFTRRGLKSFDKLVDLIEAGDATGAEAHWRLHMAGANAFWLRGVDQTAIVDILD